ncbi:MAG TPA: hypothetical protein PK239_06470 [Chitinophagales bacterium]|nr:hypothetical protein [Chitinophagales bacterium]HRK26920.1 hypothetical protein [Chitinophagales bacterium]
MNVTQWLAVLFLLLFCNIGAWASGGKGDKPVLSDPEKPKYKSIISVQPFSLIAGGLDLSFEQRFSPALSARLNFGYFLSADPIGYDGFEGGLKDMDGFRGELQIRRYLNVDDKEAPDGFYLAPYALYRQMKAINEKWTFNPDDGAGTITEVKEFASSAGGGLLVGIQFLTKRRISVDMFAGGGVYLPVNDQSSDELHLPIVNPYKKTIAPRVGFSFGVAL